MVLIELTELIRGHNFRFLKFEVNLPADMFLAPDPPPALRSSVFSKCLHRMVLIELTELIRGHNFRFLKFEVNLPADFTLDFAINLQKGL